MKPGLLCFLLLSACLEPIPPYDHALTWVCLSAEGCERSDEVELLNRMAILDNTFIFMSSSKSTYREHTQRVASDTVPAGCYLLYGLTLYGHQLEPSKLCSVPEGYDLELSIPNRNPVTSSRWLVEIREL